MTKKRILWKWLRKLLLQLSQVFRSTSLPWTSARWVRSTIKLFCTVHSLSSGDVDKSQQHWISLLKKIWERCESNSGWLGGKRECYLCAIPPPNTNLQVFVGSTPAGRFLIARWRPINQFSEFADFQLFRQPEKFGQIKFRRKISPINFQPMLIILTLHVELQNDCFVAK